MTASWPPAHLTPVDPAAILRGDGEFAAMFAEAFGSIGKDGIAGRAGEPLRPLGEQGKQFWDSVFGVGELWISIKTDTQLVQLIAEQIDRRETLRDYVAAHPDEWHMTKQLNDVEVLIVKNLSLLGFTPADRTRLGLISTKTKSKLEELMALKAKKNDG